MRAFAAKVELVNACGCHVRYLPGAMAQAMVKGGGAAIHNANGRVKSVRLLMAASTHGLVIGPPSDWGLGVRFSQREKLENGGVVWRHHPRATYE